MTAPPSDKQCAEQPQRRAVLPKAAGTVTYFDPKYGECVALAWTLKQVCAYAEQVAAAVTEDRDCWKAVAEGTAELYSIERDELKATVAERDAEKQRADSLAVRVMELEAERGEIVGYAPFGDGGFGKAVRISGYFGYTESEVLGYVAARARIEGFHGPARTRLSELRWEIRPVFGDTRLCSAILADSEGKGDA